MGSSQFEKSLGIDDNGNDDPALAAGALKSYSGTLQTTWGALDSNDSILDTLFEELVDKIWNPRWDPNSAKHEHKYSPTFLDNFKDYIIRSLQFDEMQKREQEIKDTFEATFEWIWTFDPPKTVEIQLGRASRVGWRTTRETSTGSLAFPGPVNRR